MKNEILQPVIETLQYKVNSTLGEFAKAFIERSDFEALGLIAKIGESTNSYFDGLSSIIHYDEESVVTIDVPDVVEAEVVVTEAVSTNKRICLRGAYGVEANIVKEWIKDYLIKRGGRALKNDLYEVFFKTFSNQFNAYDYTNPGDKPKWKQNVCDRIQTLRKNGVVAKSENGTEYHYYSLELEFYKNNKNNQTQVQPTLPYLADKEMTAEG